MDDPSAEINDMALKDIAFFVDPTADGNDWLRLAASIAKTHKARLTGMRGQCGLFLEA
jgi:hypothetical protein